MKRCRVCGCSETEPCITPEGPCAWSDGDPDLCTACEELEAHAAHEREVIDGQVARGRARHRGRWARA